jgi:hypothetical protein
MSSSLESGYQLFWSKFQGCSRWHMEYWPSLHRIWQSVDRGCLQYNGQMLGRRGCWIFGHCSFHGVISPVRCMRQHIFLVLGLTPFCFLLSSSHRSTAPLPILSVSESLWAPIQSFLHFCLHVCGNRGPGVTELCTPCGGVMSVQLGLRLELFCFENFVIFSDNSWVL